MNGNTRRDIVLIVDDSPETLGFISAALEQAGITALVAVDSASALELLRNITPDLVLLDAVMPVTDGFETCRKLKANKTLAHLPVVFMTGLSETQHVIEGLNAGGVDYITKPIILDELIARIHVHLANARVAHGARAALDVTGRHLIAIDASGRLIWSTLQAETLLDDAFPEHDIRRMGIPVKVSAALAERLQSNSDMSKSEPVVAGTHRPLKFSYLSEVHLNEYLFRITEADSNNENDFLRQELSLTHREAEVLVWLAHGKPNRDISEILGISPRTVNKHIERIFIKLGVETRSAAAAHATRILTLRK